MSIKLDRRRLITIMGTAIALGYLTKRQLWDTLGNRNFNGKVLGSNFKRGHHLITKMLPKITDSNDFRDDKTAQVLDVAIIGTGISGLSCAYHLAQDPNYKNANICLFELEDHLGGKSHAQNSKNIKAPWGAHYLPLPNENNLDLLNFLRQQKILDKSFSKNGLNEGYSPYMLLNAPRERLYLFGRYQDGLIPKDGLTDSDKLNFSTFFSFTDELTHRTDHSGRYAFDIPVENSSNDPQFTKYDKITMQELLDKMGIISEPLLWYINYCCRDDYGTTLENISAWAGLHYFCSRRPYAPDIDKDAVLTWPQGNNFLVKKLEESIPFEKKTAHLLLEIAPSKGSEPEVLNFFNFQNQKPVRIRAKKVVLALPQFIGARLLGQRTTYQYSPWMVANINVRWDQDIGQRFAWDNVNYKGKGLGFILAKHQELETNPSENTLTYYWPLTHLPAKEARKWAMKRTHNQWCQDILTDLNPMIFDLKERIKSIDIWPWGHGMVSPEPNFMMKKRKQTVKLPNKNYHFAHSDLSGVSLFEEAFYWGNKAAKEIIRANELNSGSNS